MSDDARTAVIRILNWIDIRVKQIEAEIEAGDQDLLPTRRELDNLWHRIKGHYEIEAGGADE